MPGTITEPRFYRETGRSLTLQENLMLCWLLHGYGIKPTPNGCSVVPTDQCTCQCSSEKLGFSEDGAQRPTAGQGATDKTAELSALKGINSPPPPHPPTPIKAQGSLQKGEAEECKDQR